MNELIKYFGVILVIIGAGVLGYYAANHITSNSPLVAALLLMVGGMVVHIVLNRVLD
jgi:membrane protein YdbS with pleckstrin-like domain